MITNINIRSNEIRCILNRKYIIDAIREEGIYYLWNKLEKYSINQGGQVTEIDIPNEDGTFTTLKGEEAKKWYNKAVEEDKEETEEESSMQSTDNEDEVQARGSFLL